MPTSTAGPVNDKFSFKLGEAAQNVHQQVRDGTCFARELSKDDLDVLCFQVALDHPEVGDVAGQPVHVINENCLEVSTTRVIPQLI